MPGNNLRSWAILAITQWGNHIVKKSRKNSKATSKGTKALASQVGKSSAKKKRTLSKATLEKVKRSNPDQRNLPTPKPAPSLTTRPKTNSTPKPKSATKTKELPTQSVLYYQEQRARIAGRAYEFYEERCRIGEDVLDWLRAEREIMQKQ